MTTAHALAWGRAGRPKPAKLAVNLAVPLKVEQDLSHGYSPEQIAGGLRVQFPDDPEMWMSTETIYQCSLLLDPPQLRIGGAALRRLTLQSETTAIFHAPKVRRPGESRSR